MHPGNLDTEPPRLDGLTGLPNRDALEKRIEDVRSALRPTNRHLLLMINPKGLHQINQAYGWQAGDEVLRHVARKLKEISEGGSFAGRSSFDDFLLFKPDVQADQSVDVAIEVARSVERERVPWNGMELETAVWVVAVALQAGCPSYWGLWYTLMDATHHLRTIGAGNVYVANQYSRI